MKLLFLGLSITSSWGNGHATTYRALLKALAARGHDILFLERDAPWYAGNRDMPSPPFCRVGLYQDVGELEDRYLTEIHDADVVTVGSYVPDGVVVGDLVLRTADGLTAFYDIDTPVTLARVAAGLEYLTPRQIRKYDLYLSFTGGPTLDRLHGRFGARCARPLYCSVDPDVYHPASQSDGPATVDLGYLGTYSADRQPVLDTLMLEAARRWRTGRFVVAGPQYPRGLRWPENVSRITHLEPKRHRQFYTTSRFTLNVTRRDMVAAGYSPSVRLFEAAACGVPILSDRWPGLETVLCPGHEILVTSGAADTLSALRDMPDTDRLAIARRARARVLGSHTAASRAIEFENALRDAGLDAAKQDEADGPAREAGIRAMP